MIPAPAIQIALAFDKAVERTMAKAPTLVRRGIPIGGSFKATDTGKVEPKPKRAKLSPPAQYAAKNKRKWRAAK
jgi:hypothetical protein